MTAHRDLLCMHSNFFAGCLNHDFTEAAKKEVVLATDTPEAVRSFLQWVYREKLEFADAYLNSSEILCSRYVFADKVCGEQYCNAFIDAVRACCLERKLYLHPNSIKALYNAGLQSKPLTKYAIEDTVHTIMTKENATDRDYESLSQIATHPELSKDFTKALVDFHHHPWSRPDQRKGCVYHEHADGKSCSTAIDAGDN